MIPKAAKTFGSTGWDGLSCTGIVTLTSPPEPGSAGSPDGTAGLLITLVIDEHPHGPPGLEMA